MRKKENSAKSLGKELTISFSWVIWPCAPQVFFISKNLTKKNLGRGKFLNFFLFSKEFRKILLLSHFFIKYINHYLIASLYQLELKTFFDAIFKIIPLIKVDYKKRSLNKISTSKSYEEIDTRLASGWYVDTSGNHKKKKYKTKKVSYTISKKQKDI